MGYPEDPFFDFFYDHVRWSKETFGPAEERGPEGPADHLRSEVEELNKDPRDLEEVADIIHLAVDVAWRAGYTYWDLIGALRAKAAKNRNRKWPDWRSAEKGKAIEHVRGEGEP